MKISKPKNSRQLVRLLRQVAKTTACISFANGFASTYAQCRHSNLRAILRVKNNTGKYNSKLFALCKGN